MELTRYKLDLVDVQEVRRDKEGTVSAGDYNFFCGKEIENHHSEHDFCTQQNSITS
jgi:hypothetical protein